MSLPILYSFRRCPYAMRARLALEYSGIVREHREILLKDKPQSMLEASPKGTVPVLILDDGKVIDESLDVVMWALRKNDPDGWLNNYNPELINDNDTWFKRALDRYKYPNRYPDEDCSGAFDACLKFIKKLDDYVKNDTPMGLTDAAIFPFVRQFSKVDPDQFSKLPYEHVKVWLDHHINSPLFLSIMKKHDLWED